jgi:hypothetical protein
LTVASSLAATLIVRVPGLRPQMFAVDRRVKHLVMRVPPRPKVLRLKLSLGSAGLTRTIVLTVRPR